MHIIELKKGDRITKAVCGLRDHVYIVFDRFDRLMLIGGAVGPIARQINLMVTSEHDRVHHQNLYRLVTGKHQSGLYKTWRCEKHLPGTIPSRVEELMSARPFKQVGILTLEPERWQVVRNTSDCSRVSSMPGNCNGT